MKLRKMLSYLVCIFATFAFVAVLSCENVNAIYEPELNKVKSYNVDVTSNNITISIQYQHGLTDVNVYICDTEVEAACTQSGYISHFIDPVLEYTEATTGEKNMIINRGENIEVYDNNKSPYTVPVNGPQLNIYGGRYDSEGRPINDYVIMITARFCQVRTEDKKDCAHWDEEKPYVILKEWFKLDPGITGSGELNQTIAKMLYIVNSIVIPILWLLLGILLIVRGIMLGIDIVKSADEPEVRKKKVNGLIWLVIGVAVGFIITGVASAIMSMFGYGGLFS